MRPFNLAFISWVILVSKAASKSFLDGVSKKGMIGRSNDKSLFVHSDLLGLEVGILF